MLAGAIAVVLLLALLLPALAVYFHGRNDQARAADVIVVLGAGLERGGRPSQALMRRAWHAAALYGRGVAEWVICSGGVGAGQRRSEAAACGELLEQSGVPAEAILLEERSRSTEENAALSGAILAERGWREVVLVSDGYHLLRARWLFERMGQPVWTSPAADPRRSWHLFYTMREVWALYWTGLRYLLNLPEVLLRPEAAESLPAGPEG